MSSTRRELLALFVVLLSIAAHAGAQRVPCDSLADGYRECVIGSSGVAQLVFEKSENRCREGVTWGTKSPGVVWVTRGCSAVFSLRTQFATTGRTRILCESQHEKLTECPADTSGPLVVARQLSRTECIEGVNWGTDRDREVVWVDDGCRAEFVFGQFSGPMQPVEVLDATLICETKKGQKTECPASTSAGVQLVRQIGAGTCRFGKEWGYDEKAIWVTRGCSAEFAFRHPRVMLATLDCAAARGGRTHCPAETRYGVAFIRNLGDDGCTLEETWGFDGDGIWVANGCNGRFALGGFRMDPSAVPPSASRVVCESGGQRTQCAVPALRGAGLVHQMSDADCVLNRTWGYDRDGIWVTAGCRAEFAVVR